MGKIHEAVYYTDFCKLSVIIFKYIKHPVPFLVTLRPSEDWSHDKVHRYHKNDDEDKDALRVLSLVSKAVSLSWNASTCV